MPTKIGKYLMLKDQDTCLPSETLNKSKDKLPSMPVTPSLVVRSTLKSILKRKNTPLYYNGNNRVKFTLPPKILEIPARKKEKPKLHVDDANGNSSSSPMSLRSSLSKKVRNRSASSLPDRKNELRSGSRLKNQVAKNSRNNNKSTATSITTKHSVRSKVFRNKLRSSSDTSKNKNTMISERKFRPSSKLVNHKEKQSTVSMSLNDKVQTDSFSDSISSSKSRLRSQSNILELRSDSLSIPSTQSTPSGRSKVQTNSASIAPQGEEANLTPVKPNNIVKIRSFSVKPIYKVKPRSSSAKSGIVKKSMSPAQSQDGSSPSQDRLPNTMTGLSLANPMDKTGSCSIPVEQIDRVRSHSSSVSSKNTEKFCRPSANLVAITRSPSNSVGRINSEISRLWPASRQTTSRSPPSSVDLQTTSRSCTALVRITNKPRTRSSLYSSIDLELNESSVKTTLKVRSRSSSVEPQNSASPSSPYFQENNMKSSSLSPSKEVKSHSSTMTNTVNSRSRSHSTSLQMNKVRSLHSSVSRLNQSSLPTNKILPSQSQPAKLPLSMNLTNIESRSHGNEKLTPYLDRKNDIMSPPIKYKNEKKNFQCPNCNYRSLLKATMDVHKKWHCIDKSYACALCDFNTDKSSNLVLHLNNCHSNIIYSCSCGFATKYIKSLQEHHETTHSFVEQFPCTGDKLFRCTLCDFKATQAVSLKIHIASHLIEKAFFCVECGFESQEINSIEAHIHTIHPCKKIKLEIEPEDLMGSIPQQVINCEKCNFTSKNLDEFNKHLSSHNKENSLRANTISRRKFESSKGHGTKARTLFPNLNQVKNEENKLLNPTLNSTNVMERFNQKIQRKKYPCSKCDFSTNYKNNLTIHFDVKHSTADKKLSCSHCSFITNSKYSYNQHVKIHREKKFKCTICDYKTIFSTRLKIHLRTHTGEKPFHCSICGFRVSQFCHLRTHMTVHDTKEPSLCCNICDFKTKYAVSLKQHISCHNGEKKNKCPSCDFRTNHYTSLKYHILRHTGLKPHECDQCDFRTIQLKSLKNHKRTHVDEKPFSCSQCKFATKHKHYLSRHALIHTKRKQKLLC